MDDNARSRLAIARIKMGDTEEGQLHASMILNGDVLDYAPLSVEIPDAYFERNLCAEAKPIYKLLGSDVDTSSVCVLMQTASCLRYLNENKEAIDVYERIRLADICVGTMMSPICSLDLSVGRSLKGRPCLHLYFHERLRLRLRRTPRLAEENRRDCHWTSGSPPAPPPVNLSLCTAITHAWDSRRCPAGHGGSRGYFEMQTPPSMHTSSDSYTVDAYYGHTRPGSGLSHSNSYTTEAPPPLQKAPRILSPSMPTSAAPNTDTNFLLSLCLCCASLFNGCYIR